jgi:hypothetical protein
MMLFYASFMDLWLVGGEGVVACVPAGRPLVGDAEAAPNSYSGSRPDHDEPSSEEHQLL